MIGVAIKPNGKNSVRKFGDEYIVMRMGKFKIGVQGLVKNS